MGYLLLTSLRPLMLFHLILALFTLFWTLLGAKSCWWQKKFLLLHFPFSVQFSEFLASCSLQFAHRHLDNRSPSAFCSAIQNWVVTVSSQQLPHLCAHRRGYTYHILCKVHRILDYLSRHSECINLKERVRLSFHANKFLLWINC